jgi:hypothetical protein
MVFRTAKGILGWLERVLLWQKLQNEAEKKLDDSKIFFLRRKKN